MLKTWRQDGPKGKWALTQALRTGRTKEGEGYLWKGGGFRLEEWPTEFMIMGKKELKQLQWVVYKESMGS